MSEPRRAPIYISDDDMINKIALPIVRVYRAEIDTLRAENARLQTENAAIDQRYREFLRDWADMDTHVRNVAKTVLAAPVVDGNSYGVPTIEDIADMLVAEVARQRHMLGPS